ncbi:MAG: ferredoxin [Myxococcales bacterium]|nr:ferredoxin [Myxococcales bacterium]
MPKCKINGKSITVERGTTIIQAAAELGFDIPHFCYHPGLSVPANCRMCLVEVKGARKLLPACYTQVSDKMEVQTDSERVVQSRRAVLEFILVNHPVDCPICDQAGECKLQDYYMDYDTQESRLRTPKVSKVKVYPIGPEVVYDGERCILCTRCVRFCDEITGTNELTVVERGDRSEIRTFPGRELDNNYSMCTVDLCPVGALTSRDFRFKCRVWLLKSTDSICAGCSRGCSIHMEQHRSEVQRYRPRYNPEINDYWMCDAGRLSYKELHRDRMLKPLINGAAYTWPQVAEKGAALLRESIDALGEEGADKVGFVFSPQSSCEGLYMARRFAEEALGCTRHYVGGRPHGDQDDFLIQRDKNPNRNGLLLQFPRGQRPQPFEQLLADMESGQIKILYMMGSEVPVEGAQAERFRELLRELDLFVLQAPRGDGLDELARVILPASTHAEQRGTYINCDGVAQQTREAFKPLGSSLPDWQIAMKLAARLGAPLTTTFIAKLQEEMWEAMKANAQPAPEAPEAETTEADDDAPEEAAAP